MGSVLAAPTGVGDFQVVIRSGDYSFLMDEPVDVGGLSSAPNPFDMLCAAIGGCTLMTLRMYAKRKGWGLDGLKVHVTYQEATATNRARLDRLLEVGEATEEQREALLRIAQRCPVHLLLERGADLTVVLSEGKLPDAAADREHVQAMELRCLEF